MTDRRTFLTLLAALPLVTGGAGVAIAADLPAARIRLLAATPTRQVEVSFWPAKGRRRGTIAFSHGFGSSPRFYPDFIRAWTGAGFDIVAPLHVDSREHPRAAEFARTAWATRIEDMRAVSAMIGGNYVAAGHSFGALTALVLGGVDAIVPPGIDGPLRDPSARTVLAFSPPGPLPPLVPEAAFAALSRPALIQTGTQDLLPSAPDDPESWRAHLTAFARSPASGDHHGLVIEGSDHYFGGLICDPARKATDQTAQLHLAVAASLAFLRSYSGHAKDGQAEAPPAFPVSPLARYYTR